MADNQLLTFIVEKLSSIEKSLVEQITIRERIVGKLDTYNETHQKEHSEIKERLRDLEGRIQPMLDEHIGRQQLRGTAHRFGKVVSLGAAIGTAAVAFWDHIKKLLGVGP